MKTKLNKVLWLVVSLLALNACKKNEDVIVTLPEQNKVAFISDNTGIIYAANALTGTSMWTYNTNGGSVYTSLAVNKDVAVFTDQQMETITCINVQNGSIKWTNTLTYTSHRCTPIIVNDKVYVASYDNTLNSYVLLGLNLSDGSKSMAVPLYSSVNGLNYSNGLLIANTCGGHLYGIELSGNVKWEYLSNSSCYHTNPAISNKILYILSSGAKLSAVNISDGTEVWNSMISGLTHDANVVYNNALLFVAGDGNNKLFAFDAANGTLKHTYTLPDNQSVYGYYNAAFIKNGIAYILSQEGTLFAFNVADETIKWQKQFTITSDGYDVRTSVAIANDVLFAAAGKNLIALDLSGNIKWQMATAGDIYNSPVILSDKDKVYKATSNGVVE